MIRLHLQRPVSMTIEFLKFVNRMFQRKLPIKKQRNKWIENRNRRQNKPYVI